MPKTKIKKKKQYLWVVNKIGKPKHFSLSLLVNLFSNELHLVGVVCDILMSLLIYGMWCAQQFIFFFMYLANRIRLASKTFLK